MKMLAKVLGVLLLLVIVGVGVAIWQIDAIAKAAVEKGGTYALGVPTTLGGASVGLFTAQFTMTDLAVANPSGYRGGHFLKAGRIAAQVDAMSLTGDLVTIPSIELSGIDVSLEQGGPLGLPTTNAQDLMANVKRVISGGQSAQPQAAPEGKPKRFKIDKLVLQDVSATLALQKLGLASVDGMTTQTLRLQRFEVRGLTGENAQGVVMNEVVALIFNEIMKQIILQSGGAIPAELLNSLTGGLEQMQADLKGQLDAAVQGIQKQAQDAIAKPLESIKGAADGAVKGATENMKGAVDKGLKGIFGGGGDEKKEQP